MCLHVFWLRRTFEGFLFRSVGLNRRIECARADILEAASSCICASTAEAHGHCFATKCE